MVRPLRVEFPGAFYHVTSRGNKKEDIYQDDKDREMFLRILGRTVCINNWVCHAYCLMNNHYHLLIETPESNLSLGMRDLNGIYTQAYNKRHGTTGHVYEGRYKAFIIESEQYLLEVARYIVLNPVRAKMVQLPGEWRWSSYIGTFDVAKTVPFLFRQKILSHFTKGKRVDFEAYKKFVCEGIEKKSPFEGMGEGVVLGSEEFKGSVWEHSKKQEEEREIKISDRKVGRPSLDDLFLEIKSKKERNTSIMIARNWCGYSVTEIADYLGLSRVTVSRLLNNV
jgi:putative transposase